MGEREDDTHDSTPPADGSAAEATVIAPAPREPEKEEKFLVVGVGASAGGLDALGELLKYVPADNMTFIVVQHLAPQHESMLTQLLARTTKLRVETAVDGTLLEANRVYVTPPNADLAVMQGVLHVMTPPSAHGPRLPIDYLFRSLADDQGDSAVGIVLSGTGTDGTLGLKAIKAAGGLTFVQDLETAKYDGMPRSALASGAADYCLAPEAIGEELAAISKRLGVRRPVRPAQTEPQVDDLIGKLFVLIRAAFGNDLSNYKRTTIDRRIERRMMLHKMVRLEDYVKLVQTSREELDTLYEDMLITVTSFFRDPGVFEAVKKSVLPSLVEAKDPKGVIRVWVPACASGEEAYSIAICLLEYLEERGRETKVQIFGTDVDHDSIEHARRGVYPANIALDVSTERLHRFFVKKEDEYLIARRVRDMVVFSKQNLLKDAPFSRMDLISCRNLLIYLQPPAQKKVLRTLHHSRNPSGYLLLGTSETVGDAPELFSLVDRKNKLYAKKLVASQANVDVSFGVPAPEAHVPALPVRPPMSLQALADRKVLELYGPAGVVINEDLEILQFRGHTGAYLDPAPGVASFNLLRLARFELHMALKSAIREAQTEQRPVSAEVTLDEDGKKTAVKLDVVPLVEPETKTRCLLVLFSRLPPPKEVPVVVGEGGASGESASALAFRFQEMERELAVTKGYLQTTVEEKESTLEELKSANEELQSSNEELQSTNEELETSKEELQSTNEELTTVNDELQNRMSELSQTNDDLYNVLAGVDNAVVIVGMDLKIRRYTVAAEKLFNLVPADIGRSIGFLDPFVGTGSLEPKVSAVIHNLTTSDEEVLASNARWYALRITPYKTLDHSIRGALITLVDIDVRKRAANVARDIGAYAAQFLAPIGTPLLIVDEKQRVVWCNQPFLETFDVSREETLGSELRSVAGRQFGADALAKRLNEVFASSTIFRDFRLDLTMAGGGTRPVAISGSQIPVSPEVKLALLSVEPLAAPSPRGGA